MIGEDVLRAVPFFVGLNAPVISSLAARAEEVRLGAGELITEQNEEARDVYFLLEGSVEALLRVEGVGDLFMGTHEQVGTLLGWSAFRPPRRYTDSVRCHGPSRLLRVPATSFEAVLSGHPAVGHQLLRRVNVQVAQQLETTRQLINAPAGQTQEL